MNQTAEEPDLIVIKLSGDIYTEEAVCFREKIMGDIEQGKKRFHIDLAAVRYIDSSGLGVLIAVQKKLAASGGQLILSGLTGGIREIFELTQLDKVFTIK